MKKKNKMLSRATLGPNWEGRQAVLNMVGGAVYTALAIRYPQMTLPCGFVGGVLLTRGSLNALAAHQQLRFEALLQGNRKPWCTFKDLQKWSGTDSIWIGFGFPWDASHCQAVKEFTKNDWRDRYRQSLNSAMRWRYVRANWPQFFRHPFASLHKLSSFKDYVASEPGYRWVHALGEERSQYLSRRDIEGHMAVFGTTGAGKSRFLEHQIVQAILQNRTVIVIDPKGDQGIERSMRKACDASGRSESFLFFHLAHSERSIQLNLLANYSRPWEVASRISDTLPGQGGEGQIFIDIGRGYLRTICDGLHILGKRPTFARLHHYFTNREALCREALAHFLRRVYSDKEVNDLLKGLKPIQHCQALIDFYRSGAVKANEIDGIISLAMTDLDTFQKMTSSTEILLSSLTRGDIGRKLSPSDEGEEAESFYNTRKIIQRNCVLYVGLDALTDSGMARAIGSMLLADLASTAGARYDYDKSSTSVSVFVDEAAELTCEPLTQMLNKSRGANFSICLASQTISDFVAKAKDRAEALRILANLNNFVAMRCNDVETQDFLIKRLPKTRITTTTHAHGVSTTSDMLMASTGSISERIAEEEVDLVPAALLGALPNCEFFGVFSGGHVIKGRVPILLNSPDEYKGQM